MHETIFCPRLDLQRIRIEMNGVVQGVGFRPFIYRLAQELKLTGWIENSSQGVTIECEGQPGPCEEFLSRIPKEKPPFSHLQNYHHTFQSPTGSKIFAIRPSDLSGEKTAWVLPDMATCPECLDDILNPSDRRYLYPFTNCTQCGPRYSIIESLPYDRRNTSMKSFVMCAACQREYDNPSDRRFHAQPNACPVCGPHVELWDAHGRILNTHHEAIRGCIQYIKKGKIAAVKGLGGFHLMVDACQGNAVERLREQKHREEKPFAVMMSSAKSLDGHCTISQEERKLLQSAQAPVVLLEKKQESDIASSVAPQNPFLGVMLAYTPLHHILLKELHAPVVATSGNLADEPICIDEHEALERLKGIADVFLVHNRPIVRQVDDSIVRIMMKRPLILRRARGFAPLPVQLKDELPSVLGLGGHLKNTVGVSVKNNVFISQHIGDLETSQSLDAFTKTTQLLQNLYDSPATHIACDRHPAYRSTQMAQDFDKPVIEVQHHHAHIVSCMAENKLQGPVLGICWDGTGYGMDGTIWGGEFLLSTLTDFERAGHFKRFPLPGGEAAVREPRRTALGILYEVFKDETFNLTNLPCIQAFSSHERKIIQRMLSQSLNSPLTSSAGRLFDAAASLIGLRQYVCFEGQAACALEYALNDVKTAESYPFEMIDVNGGFVIDWTDMLKKIIKDFHLKERAAKISAKFHNTLIDIIVHAAGRIGEEKIVLSGGCFQNKYLTEGAVCRLREEGFYPFWHRDIPPNDGGISLGQTVAAAYRLKGK